MDLIIISWQPEKQSCTFESLEAYTKNYMFNTLVSAMSCLIQTCSESDGENKDYQIIERIISNLNSPSPPQSKTKLQVIIKLENETINISFPKDQGWLSIPMTADIICYAACQMIVESSDDPEDVVNAVINVLSDRFASTELPPVVYDEGFVKKQ